MHVCGTLMGGLHMEFALEKHALAVMDSWTMVALRIAGLVEAQHCGHTTRPTSSLARPAQPHPLDE